jgi:hypothetical protein
MNSNVHRPNDPREVSMSATSSSRANAPKPRDPAWRPWYRIPAMYLVIGGPASVVVASLFTAVLAYHGADRPLLEHVPAAESTHPMAPATAARNHAVTPKR